MPLSAEELNESGDDDGGDSSTGAIVGGASKSSCPLLESKQLTLSPLLLSPGVIGGVAGLTILGFAVFWFLRRRNRRRLHPHPSPSSEAESALKTTSPPYSDRLSTGPPPSSTSPTSHAGLTLDTSGAKSPSPSDQTRLSQSESLSSPIKSEPVGSASTAGGINLENLWSGRGGQERTYVNQKGKRVRDVETKAGQL